MGIVIMVGWLTALIALAYGLVLRFDPEARPAREPEDTPT